MRCCLDCIYEEHLYCTVGYHNQTYKYLVLVTVQLMTRFAWTAVIVFSPRASSLNERFCPTTLKRPPRQSANDSGIYKGRLQKKSLHHKMNTWIYVPFHPCQYSSRLRLPEWRLPPEGWHRDLNQIQTCTLFHQTVGSTTNEVADVMRVKVVISGLTFASLLAVAAAEPLPENQF